MKKKIYKLTFSALFLALAVILSMVTGNMQDIGRNLCPMHLPVMLCGYLCGPVYGVIVGMIAPLLRFLLFGAPPIYPLGLGMAAELATYGLMTGILYKLMPKKHIFLYLNIIISIICGKVVWAVARTILAGVGNSKFSFNIFLIDGLIKPIPGIIIQLLVVPIIVILINKLISDI